jgi:tripartite-type tricarboxylate transporter receptor subunit TctC
MLSRRGLLAASAGLGIALSSGCFAGLATAQTVTRPARMLVGLAPGGGVDAVARLLAEHVKGYATSLVVENRAGAGGRIALEALKAAEADGSVMALVPTDQLSLFPYIYRRLNYRPVEDFAPVAVVCSFQFVLAIGPRVPADVTSLADFVAWSRRNPAAASVGTAGTGSLPHFLTLTLARAGQFELVHVPYKGAGPAVQDLLGGHVAGMISNIGSLQPHMQSGQLRALATTAPRRSAVFPDVPTIGEAGYPMLERMGVTQLGVVVPARTPADVIAALHKAIREAVASKPVSAALVRLGFDPADASPAEFAQIIASDTHRWAEVVKATGFQPID